MNDTRPTPPVPTWLRIWALLTVLAALPLAVLGAEVTTKKVGMVDPRGFRAPWHLFTLTGDQLSLGYLIEHGHRLFGFVVGLCCIVLALGLTLRARGGYRWLGWLALAAVSLQGVLGIFRVDRNALAGPTLALLHGCLAQLVLATLVAVAVAVSFAWSNPSRTVSRGLKLAAVGLCLLLYVQIVFGAVVRHLLDPVAQRLHVLLAFVVVIGVVHLYSSLRRAKDERIVAVLRRLLLGLVLLQPVFGVEAWVRRFGAGVLPELLPSSVGLDIARTGHHLLGTLIFSTAVALTVLLWRPTVATAAAHPAPEFEEAA